MQGAEPQRHISAMRVKQIWEYVPLPAQIKLLWERLTSSRIVTAYFLFSLCHCIIQVALQSRAFTINANAATFLWDLSVAANATNSSLIVPDLQDGYLRLCSNVPTDVVDPEKECKTVWNATASSLKSSSNEIASMAPSGSSVLSNAPASSVDISSSSSLDITSSSSTIYVQPTTVIALASTQAAHAHTTTTIFVTAVPTEAVTGTDVDGLDIFARQYDIELVDVASDHSANVSIFGSFEELPQSCVWSLYWPVTVLDNTKREDIVFIAFQVWVLGMSVVALLNESIPHILASLFTHILATGWSGYQILNTASFRSTFNKVIVEGACDGTSLLPTYWEDRAKAEYPTLALNIVALIISAFLTWRLIKLFGWQTFKRVGASLAINRIYKLVLCLSIVLQLSFFFTAATVSLWIDNLINGVAAQVVWYVALYKAVAFTVCILLIPWLASGWIALRKESRILMFAFLFMSVLYLAGWSLMFLSTTFRYTYLAWHFYSVIASLSVFLTVLSFVLGVWSRYNFGKGLLRYLNAEEPLPGADFTPVTPSTDIEKVAFPSSEKVIPTFSAAFGSGDEVPPPRQMFPARMGPRFFNRSAEPFETPTPSTNSVVTLPAPALSRAPSDASFGNQVTVQRGNTQTSIGSFDSYYNYSSSEGSTHRQSPSADTTNGRRWIIE